MYPFEICSSTLFSAGARHPLNSISSSRSAFTHAHRSSFSAIRSSAMRWWFHEGTRGRQEYLRSMKTSIGLSGLRRELAILLAERTWHNNTSRVLGSYPYMGLPIRKSKLSARANNQVTQGWRKASPPLTRAYSVLIPSRRAWTKSNRGQYSNANPTYRLRHILDHMRLQNIDPPHRKLVLVGMHENIISAYGRRTSVTYAIWAYLCVMYSYASLRKTRESSIRSRRRGEIAIDSATVQRTMSCTAVSPANEGKGPSELVPEEEDKGSGEIGT